MKRSLLLYIGFLISLIGCKKSEITQTTPTGMANFFVIHEINNSPLAFDSILYTIPSGFEISTTRLEYYISDVKFKDSNGNTTPIL